MVAVGVARAGAVEGDVEGIGHRLGAGFGDRRMVDPDRDLGLRRGVAGAARIDDRELGAVHAGSVVGALGGRPRHRRVEVVEVPAVGGDGAVGIEGGAAVEADRSARLDHEVGAGGGDRRGVDGDGDLVDVVGLGEAGVVAHGQEDALQPGSREAVGDALARGLGSVGEAPEPVGHRAVRIDRSRSVEHDLLAGCRHQVGAGVGDRCGVDAHDGGVARGVERRAAVVAHDERDLVGAGPGIGVADAAAGGGGAVAEAPLVARDGAVGVARAAAVEIDLADRDRLVGAGVGDRGGADGDVDAGGRDRRVGGGIVGDGEGDRIDAGRRPGVLHLRALAGGAVAEVPGPGQDRPVGIARPGAVEAGDLADRDRAVGAGRRRRRRGVDGDRHRVGGAVVGDAGIVLDGQGGDVAARGRVGVGDGGAVDDRAVAHVPAVAGDGAVDVVARAAAERHRLADGGLPRLAGLGDRREVDGDLAGGDAEVAGMSGVVLDPQHDAVEAGLGEGVGGGGAVGLGAVGEGPVEAGERAVARGRAGAVEGHGLARRRGDRGAGGGDGGGADVDGDARAGAAGDVVAAAEHLELGLVSAGLGEGVRDDRGVALAAVAEAPVVGERAVAGGGRGVEGDRGAVGERPRRGDRGRARLLRRGARRHLEGDRAAVGVEERQRHVVRALGAAAQGDGRRCRPAR